MHAHLHTLQSTAPNGYIQTADIFFPMEAYVTFQKNQTHIHGDLEKSYSAQVIQNTEKSCVPKWCLQRQVRTFILTL